MDDVEAAAAVDAVECRDETRAQGDQRLGAIGVERLRPTYPLELKAARREVVSIERVRSDREPGCNHRDVVPATGQFGRLAVDVLGDAAKLRVVVLADDRDPQCATTVRRWV